MKANLTFNLDDLDDQRAHARCVKALYLCLALHEISNTFRSMEKYNSPPITREDFNNILSEYDIDLDTLIN